MKTKKGGCGVSKGKCPFRVSSFVSETCCSKYDDPHHECIHCIAHNKKMAKNRRKAIALHQQTPSERRYAAKHW
jgi:hypothetical protein